MGTSRDTVRQIVVIVSAVIAIVGSFIGSGAAGGTPIQDAAGGALSASATLIAPAGLAFSIWSIIYLGLVAYAIWQALPRQKADDRQRRLGYWIAASLLLNAAWILSVQFDQLWLSLPVIVALLVVLIRTFFICFSTRPKNWVETLVVDGTIGLYLGWVCVATAANTAALLTAAGFDGFGIDPTIWAVVVVAVAGVIGILLGIRDRGRIAPALALGWGLAWLAVGRLQGDPQSTATGVVAVVAVIAVLAVTITVRVLRGSNRSVNNTRSDRGAIA
jgi:hypothetical protein